MMGSEYDHLQETETLQRELKYRFESHDLLERALTHPSYTNETAVDVSNQRLEFLGDAVLGMVVAEALFEAFPQAPEGVLSSIQARMVCEPCLAELATALDLGAYLRLGLGESSSAGRARASNLADAYESLIAAVYLDGGLDPARRVILERHAPLIAAIDAKHQHSDFKSRLQIRVQSAHTPAPTYTIVDESGPAHEKVFVAEVKVDSRPVAQGQGRTKKEAEQEAARRALEILSV